MSGETRYRAAELLAGEGAREVLLVAATEAPVRTRAGVEVLIVREGAIDLARYRANPILLDSHNAATVEAVLGSARSVDVQGGRLLVVARIACGKAGDEALALVRGGHVRAASIGYVVHEARRVATGAVDAATGVRGPALVVTRWELTEVSLVPVPADPGALVGATRAASAQRRVDPLAGLTAEAFRGALGYPVRS